MTRGTHQVGAFAAALGAIVVARPLLAPGGTALPGAVLAGAGLLGLPPRESIPWPAATVYLLVALLGGIAPDLDKPGKLWARLLAGLALGGHRHLSHSLLGAALASGLAALALALAASLLSFPSGLLWVAFVAGYLSHLALDSLTIEGVPWLFPWHVYVGLPPLARLRIRTGGWAEQFLVVPGLLSLIGWIGYRQGDALSSLWR